MLLPLDRRINDRIPWVTFGLVAVNILVFFIGAAVMEDWPEDTKKLWASVGFTPARPTLATALSHMFIHAGWEHLVGNMLFLIFLGMNCERKLGAPLFLALYFVSGLGAVALFALFALFAGNPDVPLGGASGAVSGVLGIYFALFARREIDLLWFLFFTAGTIRLPVWIFSLLWIVIEGVQAVLLNDLVMVAHWAHVGGFLVGVGGVAFLVRVFNYRGRTEEAAPETVPPPPDTYKDLEYIPLPDAPAPQPSREGRFLLVASRKDAPTGAALSLLNAPGRVEPSRVAGPLNFPDAENLQLQLGEAGFATFLLPEAQRVNVPPLEILVRLAVEERHLRLEDAIGRTLRRPLNTIYLLAAGRVRTPAGVRDFLDIFATCPWSNLRLEGEGLEEAARALLRNAGEAPRSEGFDALARDGRTPGEAHPDLAAYDAFNLWRIQLQAMRKAGV
jgi:membrane associated rhomboid family serine protease